MTNSAQKLASVKADVAAAEIKSGRNTGSVQLIAVSKTYDAHAIRPVIDAGQKVFGENRVQEARAKWPTLKADHPDIELHLIGPLQSNKTREAVQLFDVIHTIDRKKIAREIAKEMASQNKSLKLFVQVNTGNEPQKAGIAPEDAVSFIAHCKEQLGLQIAGLMCIPPVDEAPEPHFALLAKLAQEAGLKELSMGMSGDFTAAIGNGATCVRVGSAIFGARDYA